MTTPSPATHSAPLLPDQTLTLLEIAALLGRDLKTIKVRRAAGRWPNAVQDLEGRKPWRVPVADLVAAGDLDQSQLQHVENELAERRQSRETRALREQVARLEEQVAAWRALADERGRTLEWFQRTFGGAA